MFHPEVWGFYIEVVTYSKLNPIVSGLEWNIQLLLLRSSYSYFRITQHSGIQVLVGRNCMWTWNNTSHELNPWEFIVHQFVEHSYMWNQLFRIQVRPELVAGCYWLAIICNCWLDETILNIFVCEANSVLSKATNLTTKNVGVPFSYSFTFVFWYVEINVDLYIINHTRFSHLFIISKDSKNLKTRLRSSLHLSVIPPC